MENINFIYGTVFNIMEFDAHTVSWTGGKEKHASAI